MNSFGRIFRVGIYGESHGKGVSVSIDGCPPGIPFSEEDMGMDLLRRKSGKPGTTPRVEGDLPEILTGITEGKTTGAPIIIWFKNKDARSGDYSSVKDFPRPGHADFTSGVKYFGHSDHRGGGHFSGRLTLGLVAAGVVAKKIMDPVTISATMLEAGGQKDIEKAIEQAKINGDSIGALIECKANNLPAGLGEPFFDSFESHLAHLVFSIPAVKGIEFGVGFEAAKLTGSEMNDAIINAYGKTATNQAGGINGGISNGNELVFRVAVKPASSISKAQKSYHFGTGQMESMQITGRHDTCIGLRVPPVLEAVTAISLADMYLLRLGQIKFDENQRNMMNTE
ncbi:MAG TPA: chorismate synthase [Saprospiraceae bacterium]|nr:chorismate synthase [Saprospirales bacterium]HRQ30488.1 chorismate synthase [Saprospiraceae bacterium]